MSKYTKEEIIEMSHEQALDAKEAVKRAKTRKSKRHTQNVYDFFASVYYHLSGKEVKS